MTDDDNYGCTCIPGKQSPFCVIHPVKAKPKLDWESKFWQTFLDKLREDVDPNRGELQ